MQSSALQNLLGLLLERDVQQLVGDDAAVGRGGHQRCRRPYGRSVPRRRGLLVADTVQVHVSLGGAGQVVLSDSGSSPSLLDLDVHTDGGGIAGQLAVIHDTGHFQGSLQVGNAGLDRSLPSLAASYWRSHSSRRSRATLILSATSLRLTVQASSPWTSLL